MKSTSPDAPTPTASLASDRTLSDVELGLLKADWSGGRSIDGRGLDGATALMWATRNYSRPLLKFHPDKAKAHDDLIERLLNDTDVHLLDEDGCNALWYSFDSIEMAQKLMDHGLDPNVMPSCGESLLMSLVFYFQDADADEIDFEAFKAFATLFIDGGADPTRTNAEGKGWMDFVFSRQGKMQKFMQEKTSQFEHRFLENALENDHTPAPCLRTRL